MSDDRQLYLIRIIASGSIAAPRLRAKACNFTGLSLYKRTRKSREAHKIPPVRSVDRMDLCAVGRGPDGKRPVPLLKFLIAGTDAAAAPSCRSSCHLLQYVHESALLVKRHDFRWIRA